MPRVALDLNKAEDRRHVKAEWRVAPGLVPGASNEGLTAQRLASPARLADHDDSGWEVCPNIRESRSVGFTFAWYRIAVEVPATIGGFAASSEPGQDRRDAPLHEATGAVGGGARAHRARARALDSRRPGPRASDRPHRCVRAVAREPLAPEEVRRAQTPVPEALPPDRNAPSAVSARAADPAPVHPARAMTTTEVRATRYHSRRGRGASGHPRFDAKEASHGIASATGDHRPRRDRPGDREDRRGRAERLVGSSRGDGL